MDEMKKHDAHSDNHYVDPGLHESNYHSVLQSPIKLFTLILAAAVVVGLTWFALSPSSQEQDGNTQITVIRAEEGPAKVKPENEGGMQVPHQDKMVYERLGADTSATKKEQKENILPPTADLEIPLIKPEESKKDTANLTPLPLEKSEQKPAAEPTTPQLPTSETPADKTLEKKIDDLSKQTEKLSEKISPKTDALKDVPAEKEDTKPTEKKTQKDTAKAAPISNVSSQPKGVFIQLASLASAQSAEKEAQHIWRNNKEISSYKKVISKVDLGSKGTRYRILAGPFKNKALAQKACATMKKKKASCILAIKK